DDETANPTDLDAVGAFISANAAGASVNPNSTTLILAEMPEDLRTTVLEVQKRLGGLSIADAIKDWRRVQQGLAAQPIAAQVGLQQWKDAAGRGFQGRGVLNWLRRLFPGADTMTDSGIDALVPVLNQEVIKIQSDPRYTSATAEQLAQLASANVKARTL